MFCVDHGGYFSTVQMAVGWLADNGKNVRSVIVTIPLLIVNDQMKFF